MKVKAIGKIDEDGASFVPGEPVKTELLIVIASNIFGWRQWYHLMWTPCSNRMKIRSDDRNTSRSLSLIEVLLVFSSLKLISQQKIVDYLLCRRGRNVCDRFQGKFWMGSQTNRYFCQDAGILVMITSDRNLQVSSTQQVNDAKRRAGENRLEIGFAGEIK